MSERDEFTSHLLGGPWTMGRREVARRVGVSRLSARKLWRALGFPGVDDEEVVFNDTDRKALDQVVGMVRRDLIDEETAIACARALGQTTDRLVSWQVEALLEYLASRSPGGAPEDPLKLIEQLTPELEELLVYSFRRQLAATISRLDASSGRPAAEVTVCFADLVAYTRLSRRLPRRDLSRLVQRFEGLASDVVTAGGGRVIKTVGDEVLFIAPEAMTGALIALSISARMADDDLVPDVRVGMVHGPVLRSLGDVYGTTVNLASRLTSLAEPGTVITDPGTARALQGHPGIELVAQRPRLVRGFGQVQPLLVAPMGINDQLITVD
ncbi:adenylate/guanylate cyclase domain-containing protein [Kineosporia sp. J2-2]|uniref:Adenylate/guanylate cyclase domain-containing protein n=1 Tax=Kineosporia corallincola TaxID=2835133 RepID=A0ABS5TCT3_9ACTN|nr:adenylate/guanylate cyclase domain-containing protein [Kineosporia corallincola]MBT0767996.1 adenylate/guanylate cyclase domain-containing protein [Kineosporia corallincola]